MFLNLYHNVKHQYDAFERIGVLRDKVIFYMHVYFFLKQMNEFIDLFILEEWQKVLDKE